MARVLFVVASDWYFWCHWMGIAKAMRDAGHDVLVTTPDGKYVPLIRAEGLRHTVTSFDRQGRNPAHDVRTLRQLVRLCRSFKPDIVHTVAIKPILYGTLAGRLAGVRAFVHAMPGMGYVFVNDQWLARVLRVGVAAGFRVSFAGERVRVIMQNPENLETWIRMGVLARSRARLIRGIGIDTERFGFAPLPPAASGPPLVILPARLLYDKGVAEFVAAARTLRARGVVARFALVGVGDAGNPAAVPDADTARWEREGVVELFGWRDDMPEVHRQASIVCLPSYGEGLPTALLEGASTGRPLVATDVFGCREVVRHGENGLLVPVRNADALADALGKLIADRELAERMGKAGRHMVVDEFSLARVSAQTLAVYEEILQR
jgi:glycosyltransferase involved in cell wall biosynthesis